MWWNNYIDNKGQITLTVDKAIDILHSGGDIKNFVLQPCEDVNKYNSYNNNITHVVGIQPDHPDRTNNLDDMIRYFIDNKYDDLVTVDRFGTRNGSIRIVKAEYVESGAMSRRVGSMLDDCTNIHSEEDLKQAERNIQNNE